MKDSQSNIYYGMVR